MKNNLIPNFILVILTIGLLAVNSYAQKSDHPHVPKLTGPVYDETGTLSNDQADALRRKLLANEDSTSTQIVIVIVNSLNGNPVSDYAFEIGNQNKIGQNKKNNGAVILISKGDRKGFIATGSGVETVLTDAICSDIYHTILVPALKEGDFYGGLQKTTDGLIRASAGEYTAPAKNNRIATRNEPSGGGALMIVIFFFIAIIVIRALIGSGAHRTVVGSGGGMSGCFSGILSGLFWSSIFSNRGGGWGSGGGWSGGGFTGGGGGGWSGGGGSFGGGGAGGDW